MLRPLSTQQPGHLQRISSIYLNSMSITNTMMPHHGTPRSLEVCIRVSLSLISHLCKIGNAYCSNERKSAKGREKRNVIYSLAEILFFSISSFARSRSCFRKILPDGFLGIASINTTPPVIRLIADTFPFINSTMSASVALCSGLNAIYARGRSSSFLFANS